MKVLPTVSECGSLKVAVCMWPLGLIQINNLVESLLGNLVMQLDQGSKQDQKLLIKEVVGSTGVEK